MTKKKNKEDKDSMDVNTVTQTVIEVLKSLNVINENGSPKEIKESKPEKHESYVSSKFGSGSADNGAAFDDMLSQSSMLPIHQVPGARQSFQGMKSAGINKGPVDIEKMRTAGGGASGMGRGTTSFMGLGMDPLIGNSFSMLNFSSSRENPYMVNRMYGSGMYGDIPVYFLMMQEQNGGLLYWPVSIREKYNWMRYFYRTDPYVGSIIDLHTDLPISRIGFTKPKLNNDPTGERAKSCLKYCQKWSSAVGLFDRILESVFEWTLLGNCFPGNHRVHTPKGMIPICEIRDGDLVLTHTGTYNKVNKPTRRWVSENLVDISLQNMNGFEFTPTEEHPILVHRNNKDEFVKAKDLRRGDYVSIWHFNEELDVSSISVLDQLKSEKILESKYDEILWDGNTVNVKYKTRGGVSDKTADIKDKILNWLSSINKPVIMNCIDLAKNLDIEDPSRLRSVVYSLKKKGVIETKWVNGVSKEGECGGNRIKWSPLEDKISVNDIYYREWEKNFDLSINDIEINDDFLYFLGYWFGDGWLWKNKRKSSYSYMALDICISKNDEAGYERLKNVSSRIFGEENVSFADGSYCNDHLNHIIIEDSIFCEWWSFHFGESSLNKKIPEWILGLNKSKLSSLLSGYIDSDGCVSGSIEKQKIISIISTTEPLIQGMFKVGLKCGIPFAFSKKKGKNTKTLNGETASAKDFFSLSTSRFDFINNTELKEKSNKVSKMDSSDYVTSSHKEILEVDGRFYYRISNIDDKFYTGYVYNFGVEEDHSYCVENINTHNCYIFCEWDTVNKWWKKMTILPPEEVGIVHFPFCDFAFAEYRPEPLIQLVNAASVDQADSSQSVTPLERAIYDNIPGDIVKSIQQFGSIIMDTNSNTGSFVQHLARKRSPYQDLGVSTLERVIIPLLQKEHFKYTQLSLSSRLMTPRNKIAAPGISPGATDNLRSEIDLSMEDPDYHVITNFDFSWDLIGAENRLIALQPEYERIENEIFAALGATRELVTGESSYGGARVTAEILNTRYLLVRDIFQNFIDEKLLKPMAVANEWYEDDENGVREYYYPKLSFNRLTIRDNQEMFDSLFQLYQKGSLPIKIIYELFNLDENEMNDLLVDDMFTARDATFNEMLRQIHTDLAEPIVAKTDLSDRIIKYLGLTKTDEEGVIQTTPVSDLGKDIFSAPEEDKKEEKEDSAPEEEGETGGEEAGGELDEFADTELEGEDLPEESTTEDSEEPATEDTVEEIVEE